MKDYFRILTLNYLLIILTRVVETILLAFYHNPDHLLQLSLMGIASDILLFTIVLTGLSPIFYFLQKISLNIARVFFIVLTGLFWTVHFVILPYYIIEFKPLDIFIFHYSWKEIYYTIRTSGIIWQLWISLFLLPGIVIFIYNKSVKINISLRYIIVPLAISLPTYLIYEFYLRENDHQKVSENKSVYFYFKSLEYLTGKKQQAGYYSENIREYQQEFNETKYLNDEYPFLHQASQESVLSPFFQKSKTAPNIVIIIVEGLNNSFVNEINGISFMPFLDSLKSQSLYWDHFLTNGERSFAVVPSLTGSLPYGEKGFTWIEKMPIHFSLINVLNSNNYFTGFYYGQGAWMHQKDRFFKMSNIDLIFDKEKFSSKYRKIITGNDKYFWGYNDKQLFDQYFEFSDTLTEEKRLDIFFTGTMHSPFAIESETYYKKKFQGYLDDLKDKNTSRYFNIYQKYFLSVMFADDALRSFFERFKTRESFKNTIFIITGDHPMTEIPPGNSLKRYHVPLIIFSPLLTDSATFHGLSSQLDLYDPLLGLLHENFNVKIPAMSSALNSTISVDKNHNWNKKIAFMNDNRKVVDYVWNGYLLSNGIELYKIDPGLELSVTNDKILRNKIIHSLELFQHANLYASFENKLMPDYVYYEQLGRNIIYHVNKDFLSNRGKEFTNLTPIVTIPGNTFTIDISFDYFSKNKEFPTGVYQLKNEKDSLVHWESFKLPLHNRKIILEKKLLNNEPNLRLQIYLWNQNKINFELNDLKLYVTE